MLKTWGRTLSQVQTDHWRIVGGGSKAIILEIPFVQLLIATDLELRMRKLPSELKDTLLIASDLTWQHAQRWKTYRSKFKGFEGGKNLMYDMGPLEAKNLALAWPSLAKTPTQERASMYSAKGALI